MTHCVESQHINGLNKQTNKRTIFLVIERGSDNMTSNPKMRDCEMCIVSLNIPLFLAPQEFGLF